MYSSKTENINTHHISGDRRLWRRNAKTLTEDTHPVGEARTVPQQHPAKKKDSFVCHLRDVLFLFEQISKYELTFNVSVCIMIRLHFHIQCRFYTYYVLI